MKSNNNSNKIYFIIFSQFSIAFFPFYFDLILLSFFIYSNNTSFKLNKFILLPIFLFIIFALLHELRYLGNNLAIFPKSLFSDLRPFVFLLLSYSLVNKLDVNYHIVLNVLLTNSSINFLVNFIGYINSDLYRTIVSTLFNDNYIIIYHSEINGFPTSLSYISSLQDRFCGAYLQPISAGLSSSFIILTVLFLLNRHKFNFKVFIILLFSIFNGFVSYSTMFHVLPFFIILFYVFIRINIFLLLLFCILFFGLLIIILSFVDFNDVSFLFSTITSGRYSNDKNIADVIFLKKFNLVDFFIGFDPYSLGHQGKGVGDSGFFIKWISGGVLYIIFYFILLYFSMRFYFNKISIRKDPEFTTYFNFLFFVFLLVELGTTPFSLPQFSIFFYLVLLLLIKLNKSRIEHSSIIIHTTGSAL